MAALAKGCEAASRGFWAAWDEELRETAMRPEVKQ